METMLEKAARAVYAHYGYSTQWEDAADSVRHTANQLAKAALTAIMEPSDAVTWAGENAALDTLNSMPQFRAMEAGWKAMIQSILSEEG